MDLIKNIPHIAAIFAIPLFALLVYYFNNKKKKTIIEYILYLFGISGLIFDTIFTYLYLSKY